MENIPNVLIINGLIGFLFYMMYKINRYAFAFNTILLMGFIFYVSLQDPLIVVMLELGCPLLLINTGMYVFLHTTNRPKSAERKYRVQFASNRGNFKLENIKRGASVIG
ncbi:hypothetical protein LCGC14_2253000, partial [marine sediment metagenome]